jgi:hypothetical protein
MYATDPKSRNWRNYLLTGLGALPFVGGASLLGRATRNVPTGFGNQDGMITYHGSPHRINNVDEANPVGKFDLSKVGTGEGAQAYGHGVYLAENPQVAGEYIRAGKDVGFSNWDSVPTLAGKAFAQAKGDRAKALSILDAEIAKTSGDSKRMNLRLAKGTVERGEQIGNFYTVDLPDEHIAKMLDWDAPLSEQPETVQRVARESGFGTDPSLAGKYGDNPVGAHLYRELTDTINSGGGPVLNDLKQMLAEGKIGMFGEAPQKASEYLRHKYGLPGIRYFDAGSRSAGDGTRNFVIFDPDVAKILKRE